jgi:hypothetical protein
MSTPDLVSPGHEAETLLVNQSEPSDAGIGSNLPVKVIETMRAHVSHGMPSQIIASVVGPRPEIIPAPLELRGTLADGPNRGTSRSRVGVRPADSAEASEPDTNSGEGDNNGDKLPPTGGGASDNSEDNEDPRGRIEATLRQAYGRFQSQVEAVRAQVSSTGTGEPGVVVVPISEGTGPEAENYVACIIPEGDEQRQAAEQARYEALIRAAQITDTDTLDDLESIAAYDIESSQIITRDVPGPLLEEMTAQDKKRITWRSLDRALSTIETMIENGIIPDGDFGKSIHWDNAAGRLRFTNYRRLEDVVDVEEPLVRTLARSYLGLADQLVINPPVDGTSTNDLRSLHMARGVLRDRLLYTQPFVAFATETVGEEEINILYDSTTPRHRGTAVNLSQN